MNLIAWIVLGIIIIIIVIILAGYSIAATYQHSYTTKLNFNNTYKYFGKHCLSLDYVKIKISGSVKNNTDVIVSNKELDSIVYENLIKPYENSIIVHESQLFIDDIPNDIRRISVKKNPSLEYISFLFFQKLSKVLSELGVRLIYVKIGSGSKESKYSKNKYYDEK